MTEDEILENNKLIAKFMGAQEIVKNKLRLKDQCYYSEEGGRLEGPISDYPFNRLRYNFDWSWTMKVIEKIESISELSQNRKCNFHVTIEKHRCFIKWGIGYTICDINDYRNSKMSIVYKAIIEFIKWYNQNKKI